MNTKLKMELRYQNDLSLDRGLQWTCSIPIGAEVFDFGIPSFLGLKDNPGWSNPGKVWKEEWETFLTEEQSGLTRYWKNWNGGEDRNRWAFVTMLPAAELFSGTRWKLEQLPAADITFRTLEDGLEDAEIVAWLLSLKKLDGIQKSTGFTRRGLFTEERIRYKVSRSPVAHSRRTASNRFNPEDILVGSVQKRYWIL